jgi:hypothetical protein
MPSNDAEELDYFSTITFGEHVPDAIECLICGEQARCIAEDMNHADFECARGHSLAYDWQSPAFILKALTWSDPDEIFAIVFRFGEGGYGIKWGGKSERLDSFSKEQFEAWRQRVLQLEAFA